MELRLANHVNTAEIDGELVLLDVATGNFYGLNQTGSILIKIIEGNQNIEIDNFINQMAEVWNVDFKDLENDVMAFINTMKTKGLIYEVNS
ncbi:PqqD family protein [Paenibacillus cellulositrophicus]|uniref:PqqD family protein n=1 Tax=Paenibacillus cellulositrophicus TaxID=562959 RepID=UPI00203F6CB0|nr:PqqD family protein [Paenibacillus cellulositrophicus]